MKPSVDPAKEIPQSIDELKALIGDILSDTEPNAVEIVRASRSVARTQPNLSTLDFEEAALLAAGELAKSRIEKEVKKSGEHFSL